MDQATLKELLRYDEDTGLFTWVRSGAARMNNSIAGTKRNNGYIAIFIKTKSYYAHRLAWIYAHGTIEDGMQIDHINGDRSDNRIANLRIGTIAQNQQNLKAARRHNKENLLGVCFDKANQKYLAQIKAGGRNHSIGRFSTAEEAHAAYLDAKRRLHEFCTI